MMTKASPFPTQLSEKYRPKHVVDFIGLAKPRRVLEAFIKRPFVSSWFFLGPSGVGKTTLAMALGHDIHAQVIQVASRECDLERVRQVVHECHNAAFDFTTGKASKFHLVIINEANEMTPAAQETLLSKLDATAPPPKTMWIFTANTTTGLAQPFLSRSRLLEFSSDSLEGELASHLRYVYRKEGGKFPLDYEAIAKSANYNVRDALMKLEVELLIGTDRKGLPADELKIIAEHSHSCKKPGCNKTWKHSDPMCNLPYRSVCPECGGARSAGSAAAYKAHETIRRKAAERAVAEFQAKQKKKKKGKQVA